MEPTRSAGRLGRRAQLTGRRTLTVLIMVEWEVARNLPPPPPGVAGGPILVLDEIQKVGRWSETVKRLWDEDAARGSTLGVILLGSAPLPIQQGLDPSPAASKSSV